MNNEQNDTETKQKLAKATEQLTKANETIGTMIDQIGMLQLKDKATTEQRDRLAEAMQQIASSDPNWRDCLLIAREALQSLDQPEQNNMKPEQNNMNTPTPSPYATDGQRTTDAECWMNYCLEAEKELTAAREELETERIRLAACGVVAMADTKESRTKAREMLPEYRSASLSDVERRVDECIEFREQRDTLAEALNMIYSACQGAEVGQYASFRRVVLLIAKKHSNP